MRSAPSGQDRVLSGIGSLVAEVRGITGDTDATRWIVAQSCGLSPAELALSERVPDQKITHRALAMARRVAAGEPLQYVLGTWGFRSLDLVVDRRVLIPRPETEQVVGFALDALHSNDLGGRARAVDLGTGSGAIALSLALESSVDLEVWACDTSAEALAAARVNLRALAVTDPLRAARVRMCRGDWFGALSPALAGTVDLIVSNPPYVSDDEWTELDPVVRGHEPRRALVGGPSGTEALRTIVEQAPRWLLPGGTLVLELAPHQAAEMRAWASTLGLQDVEVRTDHSGRDRALVARSPRT